MPAVARAADRAIAFDAATRSWMLRTADSTYVVGVNENGRLQERYWGAPRAKPLAEPARSVAPSSSFGSSTWWTNIEYPGWGTTMEYDVPALKATFADGDRALNLRYSTYRIDGDLLTIRLVDASGLVVELNYRVYPSSGIVAKWTGIHNDGAQPVTLESAQSGVWFVPRGPSYRLTYLRGGYFEEFALTRTPVTQGTFSIGSRTGTTGHAFNPWFALDDGNAAQERGNVWFGALGWSGNWRIAVEQNPSGQVRVVGGFNPFDFGYLLQPGETLETPRFYGGFTTGGFGEASRMMHRFEQTHILPDRDRPRPRPVVYDSWEATGFDVTEAGQEALAAKAARAGVELFLVDDGWFGERNNDRAGLGDWYPSATKFPHGLGPLIRYVEHLGMRFGLWMEPEMVNPDSALYRAHPDWIVGFHNRPHTQGRHQYVLNLARDDVRDWVFETVDRVVSKNHITFLKWDMNRSISEPGWPQAPIAQQKEIWVKYVRNLYAIIDRLRAKHPDLEIQTCSGGGGRVDLGILQRTDEAWTSDNTDPYDRLFIQNGFSYAYTPQVMVDWVTDHPEPLTYAFLVAMQGTLGLGADLSKWTPSEMALAGRMVAYYKSIRQTVQFGSLYRLEEPSSAPWSAREYVARDESEAAFFAYLHGKTARTYTATFRLRGLDPAANYAAYEVGDGALAGAKVFSGRDLMEHGITVRLSGTHAATSVRLRRKGVPASGG